MFTQSKSEDDVSNLLDLSTTPKTLKKEKPRQKWAAFGVSSCLDLTNWFDKVKREQLRKGQKARRQKNSQSFIQGTAFLLISAVGKANSCYFLQHSASSDGVSTSSTAPAAVQDDVAYMKVTNKSEKQQEERSPPSESKTGILVIKAYIWVHLKNMSSM